MFRIGLGAAHQYADAAHPLGLLSARRERPSNCRAADERDEVATFHCPMPPVPPTERIAHTSVRQEIAALRDFNPAYVADGSQPERLAASKSRPQHLSNRKSPAPVRRLRFV